MHIYLYVKQHQSTGLLYFGKTTCRDPFKYQGSGKHWVRHLRKHGDNISTIELWGFDNQDACTRFATEFSERHHIVESKEWANFIPENGMDGWSAGTKRSEEFKAKLQHANLGKKLSEETKAKIRAAKLGKNLGNKHSEETKAKIGAVRLGTKLSEKTKAKIRASALGIKRTEETRKKMSASKKGKGRPHTEETKRKISEARRKNAG